MRQFVSRVSIVFLLQPLSPLINADSSVLSGFVGGGINLGSFFPVRKQPQLITEDMTLCSYKGAFACSSVGDNQYKVIFDVEVPSVSSPPLPAEPEQDIYFLNKEDIARQKVLGVTLSETEKKTFFYIDEDTDTVITRPYRERFFSGEDVVQRKQMHSLNNHPHEAVIAQFDIKKKPEEEQPGDADSEQKGTSGSSGSAARAAWSGTSSSYLTFYPKYMDSVHSSSSGGSGGRPPEKPGSKVKTACELDLKNPNTLVRLNIKELMKAAKAVKSQDEALLFINALKIKYPSSGQRRALPNEDSILKIKSTFQFNNLFKGKVVAEFSDFFADLYRPAKGTKKFTKKYM